MIDQQIDSATSKRPSPEKFFHSQLWQDNPALVQMLGLCPLLAVSNTLVNSIGLAFATIITVTLSNALVSASRHFLIREIRIPAYVLIIAGIVTITDLMMQAFFHEIHLSLGIFIPLIITNCAIIARAEIFASRNPVLPSVVDGIATGAGFAAVLCILGGLRELIGSGTLLSGAELLFGPHAAGWTLDFGANYSGLLLAILPPGAFIILGLLLAVKNLIDQSQANR